MKAKTLWFVLRDSFPYRFRPRKYDDINEVLIRIPGSATAAFLYDMSITRTVSMAGTEAFRAVRRESL